MGKLIVYRRTDCPSCDRLEMILRNQRVTFTVVNHSLQPELSMDMHRSCMERRISCRGYPMVEDHGKIIETGSAMFALLHRVDPYYSVESWREPLAQEPEGDGNLRQRKADEARANFYDGNNNSMRTRR